MEIAVHGGRHEYGLHYSLPDQASGRLGTDETGLAAVSAATTATMESAATAATAMETPAAMEATGKAGRAAMEAAAMETATAVRPDPVAGPPAAETAAIDVVAVVAAEPVGATAISAADATGHRARREGEQQDERRLPACEAAHLASPESSSSDHCSSPNRAPCGSAASAMVPPWLSSCGATTTVPPSRVTFAAVAAMSATRT